MSTNFGRDVSCLNGMKTGRLVSGIRLVGEAAYRRLITPRGMLLGGDDEQNYGFDLANRIGSASTKSDAAALPAQIEGELLKDERIVSVDTTVSSTVIGPATTWAIAIEAQTATGTFSLVLSIADVTVSLLGLETTGT